MARRHVCVQMHTTRRCRQRDIGARINEIFRCVLGADHSLRPIANHRTSRKVVGDTPGGQRVVSMARGADRSKESDRSGGTPTTDVSYPPPHVRPQGVERLVRHTRNDGRGGRSTRTFLGVRSCRRNGRPLSLRPKIVCRRPHGRHPRWDARIRPVAGALRRRMRANGTRGHRPGRDRPPHARQNGAAFSKPDALEIVGRNARNRGFRRARAVVSTVSCLRAGVRVPPAVRAVHPRRRRVRLCPQTMPPDLSSAAASRNRSAETRLTPAWRAFRTPPPTASAPARESPSAIRCAPSASPHR